MKERGPEDMGRPFFELLDGRIYVCIFCKAHLAKHDEIVSKQFHSKSGKAYLFNAVVNVCTGPSEERMMTTGLHLVCDVFCTGCLYPVGWKYELAHEKSQKYKEGKVILERAKILDVDSEDLRAGIDEPGRDSDSDTY